MAVLQVYNNYIEANIALGRLEAEGIECWLKDENTVVMDPMLTHAIGGIKLLVAENHLQEARAVLYEISEQEKKNHACTKCGSLNIALVNTPRKAVNWFWALIGFFTTNYAMAVEKVYHCFDCGNEFLEEGAKSEM